MSTFPVVAIAGLPGAALTVVSGHLYRRGWDVLWPRQNVSVAGVEVTARSHMNYECIRLHSQLFDRHKLSMTATTAPRWYADDIPGPMDYCAKFTRPFLVSDSRLAFVLDWWFGYVHVVVDVQVDDETAGKTIESVVGGRMPPELLRSIVDAWRTRYETNLRLFPGRVVTLTQEEVLAGKFGGLDDFLKEIMDAGTG